MSYDKLDSKGFLSVPLSSSGRSEKNAAKTLKLLCLYNYAQNPSKRTNNEAGPEGAERKTFKIETHMNQ